MSTTQELTPLEQRLLSLMGHECVGGVDAPDVGFDLSRTARNTLLHCPKPLPRSLYLHLRPCPPEGEGARPGAGAGDGDEEEMAPKHLENLC
ncbi:myb-related transcription factor, partner of profilin-like [Acipenser oxyrinchus oxyrinchus]|uniref:Myb-related transcription factor, partner of profilin-like n=1 Tax=Acipenser oxyrinchus oxyrinchus TaxID=40147 RepID=A0AAD8G2H7_ACIOX|nr:myb-related transcription factor, partner of profilin-like [Acipenser oxyrinchus oxyrinchus]